MKNDMLIGEVTGVHGVHGEIKIRPLTDVPERFYDLKGIYLNHKGHSEYFEIDGTRLHKGSILISLVTLKDRTRAEGYRGAEVWIKREDAVALTEDEYFISDLIGLHVEDKEKGKIGIIKNILTTTGSVDTVEIKTAEKLIYVPFRKIYFQKIDFETETATTDIPDEFFNL